MTHNQHVALAAATLGSFVALLDSTVVGIAVPAIGRDLGGGLESQQWIVNVYLLALGSLILIGGSLGDVFGERRVFLLGAAGFGIASAGCAVAGTLEALIAARGIQGVCGALLTPASLAVIVAAFPPDERGKAIGAWAAFSGIAAIVGPLIGGWLIDSVGWRWIFTINLPLIVAVIVLAARLPARTQQRVARRPDWVGAGLCMLGFAGTTWGLVRQPTEGWADPLVAAPLAAGALSIALFLLWELHGARDPMLPLGLFRRPTFAWGNLETFLVWGALGLLFFVLVVFLQQFAGYNALEAGAATVPTTVALLLFSQRFGAIADRLGPRRFMTLGPLVSAVGVAYLLVRIDDSPDLVVDILPGMTIFALGLAALTSPLTTAVLSDAHEDDAGIASGVNNAAARIAGLLATSAVGSIAGGTLDLDGSRTSLAVVAGLLVLGGLTGAFAIRDPGDSSACGKLCGVRTDPSVVDRELQAVE